MGKIFLEGLWIYTRVEREDEFSETIGDGYIISGILGEELISNNLHLVCMDVRVYVSMR